MQYTRLLYCATIFQLIKLAQCVKHASTTTAEGATLSCAKRQQPTTDTDLQKVAQTCMMQMLEDHRAGCSPLKGWAGLESVPYAAAIQPLLPAPAVLLLASGWA